MTTATPDPIGDFQAELQRLFLERCALLRARIFDTTPCGEPVPAKHDLYSSDAFRNWLQSERGLHTMSEIAAEEEGTWIVRVSHNFRNGVTGVGYDDYEVVAIAEAYCNWMIYRRKSA